MLELRQRSSGDDDADVLEIGADERDAALLFLRLGTQWRYLGLHPVRCGLEYAAIEPTARMLKIAMTTQLFDDLQLMEREALREFARR